MTILCSLLGHEFNRWLVEIAEHMGCLGMGKWQVLDSPATLEALLAVKAASQPLSAGRVVLGLADAAREGRARGLRGPGKLRS